MIDKNMSLDELVQFFYSKYETYIKKSKENIGLNLKDLNLNTSNEYNRLEAE